jgi:AhpD family alkylhydroperoxidase
MMAHSPVVLQSYIAIQQVIADYGSFDARTREAIALAVGNADECNYCQAAHTGGGKAAGLTNDEMIAIRRGEADFDAKLEALLTLAHQYTPTSVPSRTPPGRLPSTRGGATSRSPSCLRTSR